VVIGSGLGEVIFLRDAISSVEIIWKIKKKKLFFPRVSPVTYVISQLRSTSTSLFTIVTPANIGSKARS
jgi:hypothetical protein